MTMLVMQAVADDDLLRRGMRQLEQRYGGERGAVDGVDEAATAAVAGRRSDGRQGDEVEQLLHEACVFEPFDDGRPCTAW
jgi:hypothetical protein